MEAPQVKPKLLDQAHFLADTVYLLTLATSKILEESEHLLKIAENGGWKQERKQLFTRFLSNTKNASLLADKIFQDVVDSDADSGYKYLSVWQQEYNEIARLALLIAARIRDKRIIEDIENYISNLPSDPNCTKQLLNNFRIKEYHADNQ